MRVITMVLLCATLACGGSPVAPADVAGTYGLVSADGEPLPVRVHVFASTEGIECVTSVGGGALSLYAGGGYELLLLRRTRCGSSYDGSDSQRVIGNYVMHGGEIELQELSLDFIEVRSTSLHSKEIAIVIDTAEPRRLTLRFRRN